jgi:hypothetical protein
MVIGYILTSKKEETEEFVKVNHLITMESSLILILTESKTFVGYRKITWKLKTQRRRICTPKKLKKA